MVSTTWARAAIASSVKGWDASARISGQSAAFGPNIIRTPRSRSLDRPANAIRAVDPL
ncbi:Uncharacterised protein [Mycobacterium tuberculosis]|uniref:Uncharacterized protein n=1 Tax=Mycobacterium tuberculosis TaxID=1773 RepID=A0A0T7LZM5_MYCTX|nr:Uncharacterised protein [Mycobacterium tuberculosis]CFE74894.1 Uncharacterised protein [Mycobacterium tuberculosis]CKR98521.1 Uncharacterised protein [Mycobacterium tuberculosis]CNV76426.1 Uncharacterised protein [Mycobacterium tuberculosis]COW42282.1 Uncharacterised protein [Mycobacterium tuberculosis]